MDGYEIEGLTLPLRIVSQRPADGNIPELDCCGEAVEYDAITLKS
jgi:hypothetical protein